MDPAYLCSPGELEALFADWEILQHTKVSQAAMEPVVM